MKNLLILFIVSYLIVINFSYSQTITSYQAEAAELYNAIIETEHSGYTGTGYVNYDNAPGGYIEWTVYMASPGTQNVDFIYANGTTANRYLEISVNNNIAEDSLSFIGTSAWTNWQTQSISVALQQGQNIIRATGITSDGGPNIDRIDVTGDPGVIYYTLNVDITGNGSVTLDPPGLTYEQGTIVTLIAQPDPTFEFFGWLGDLTGNENPDSLIIDSDKEVTAAFYNPSDTIVTIEDSPVGFATVNALGQDGTYGGEGGEVVYISSAEVLDSFFLSRKDANFNQKYPPMIVMIQGNLSGFINAMMDIKETYDLTILGDGKDAQIEGFGFNIFRSHNIIVRNIKFKDCPDDAINITDALSHHIWIDHCTFTDSPAVDPNGSNHDGLLDIKHGASYVTVSWCYFTNHRKTCLLGHSDSNVQEDIGKLKTTYHHNWFEDTKSRHPRVRFAECHVYNNFYDGNTLMEYGIASTMDAYVLVESNFFLNVPNPTHSGYAASLPGDILEINNIYVNSGEPETTNSAFDPSAYYDYDLSNTAILPVIIPKYAGSGKFDFTIPVELVSFKGRYESGKVILDWITATETNNLGFEIDRKIIQTGDEKWITIGFREGKGTTTDVQYYQYIDNITDLTAGLFNYRLKQMDFDGTYEYSDEVLVENLVPKAYTLNQNYPNPFNPITKINFELPYRSKVQLIVYDILGNKVITLINEEKDAGYYSVNFDTQDEKGVLSSGIYLYTLYTDNFVQSKKMLLLK